MDYPTFDYAERRVSGPATALLVTSALTVALTLLALVFDLWLLLSGAAGELEQPRGMSKETQVTIRAAWTFLMLLTSAVILAGALQMKRLRGRGLPTMACILALIPCLGPCFVVGIPFGIWGLVVLNDPQVRRAFDS